MIKKKYPTDGSEIVLLTDGEDNTISMCFNMVKQSGAIIHTVALGPSAAAELEQLSQMTGEGWRIGLDPVHFLFHWTEDSMNWREAGIGVKKEGGGLLNQLVTLPSLVAMRVNSTQLF